MNKIFNINLGGYPFTIDENAYEHLSTYLKTIHNHFNTSEGYEEITADIESRMAELIHERLNNRPIVDRKDVEATISIMGTPEDFGAEPVMESFEDSESTAQHKAKTKKRRLYRDPDSEIVAGVASGVAAYFGISDPIWIRLLFVLVTIPAGAGIPLYLILWAILPKADSAGDKLAMKGEPINVSNIAKTIEEEVTNLGAKINDLSASAKKKMKASRRTSSDAPLRKGFHC